MNLNRVGLAGVLLCLSLSSALAQFTSAIQGVVTDASGASIPEAVVRVTNVASGLAREVTTSEDGLYRVTNLGAGTVRNHAIVEVIFVNEFRRARARLRELLA